MSRRFDHVDLRVADLVQAAPFYEALLPELGFTLRVVIKGWLQFEAAGVNGEATEFFGITENTAHVPNDNRIAFRADSKARVDELAAILLQLGAGKIEGPGYEAEDYYAVYFDDPSGNRLEIAFREKRFTRH